MKIILCLVLLSLVGCASVNNPICIVCCGDRTYTTVGNR